MFPFNVDPNATYVKFWSVIKHYATLVNPEPAAGFTLHFENGKKL